MNRFEGTALGPVVQARRIDRVVLGADVPPPSALAGLPPVEAAFTGRAAELADLAGFLDPGVEPPAAVGVLVGPPGIGKTALALRAAHAAVAAGWFPGGVLFQDLRGFARADPLEPEAALEVHLRALGVAGQHLPPDLAGRAALHRSLLAERPGRVLLVLDDAGTAAGVAPLLPGDRRHRVLVTSRDALGDLAPARRWELGVLSGDESVTLVARLLDVARDGDDRVAGAGRAADELAALCGHLPQALAIAGGLLACDPGRPVAELVRALADRGERLAELETGARSVRAALDLSYERLPAPAARLFRLLAANPGPTIAAGAAAALAEVPERAARRCLAVLRQAHLVEPAEPRGWFRFHDLIRLYAEDRLRDQPDPTALRRLLAHHNRMLLNLVVHTFPDKLITVEPGPSSGGFAPLPEMLAWFDAERPNLVAAFREAAARGLHADVAHNATMLGVHLQMRGGWDEALAAHRMAVEAGRAVGDPVATGYSLAYLGKAHSAMRDFDRADHVLREALDGFRRGGDRGAADWVSVELESNRLQARQADPGSRVGSGAPPPRPAAGAAEHDVVTTAMNALHALSNTATELFRQGRYDDALARFEEVLEVSREVGFRPGEASTLTNIGNCHYHRADLGRAVDCYTASAEVAREVGNLHGEALTRTSLGNCYDVAGLPDEAVAQFERALEAFRALGDRHAEGTTLFYLGRTLADRDGPDDRPRARDHLRRCLELLAPWPDYEIAAWARERLADLDP
ncbi:tetratricopeptide repeat protein [Saccharothrix xinjiangensis]|uniref:Tetratricopeptide repeat protein n=1 Tax=Saccharothrix xinjiangensis TaxID=204798 RepID=A0ABV9Y4Z9_9PSEU